MRLVAYPRNEPCAQAWLWRLALGPASLVDGVVETATLGFFGVGAKIAASRGLARARMAAGQNHLG